jgi:hypothetical protein
VNDQPPKVAGTVPSSVVRDLREFGLKMTETIWPAFRDGLPEGNALRDAIHELRIAENYAGRLMEFSLDPELAKVSPYYDRPPANSAPKS